MTTLQLPRKLGCVRRLGHWPDVRHCSQEDIKRAIKAGRWRNRTDDRREYHVGPLCPEHQPPR
jgi:hypothetical protein